MPHSDHSPSANKLAVYECVDQGIHLCKVLDVAVPCVSPPSKSAVAISKFILRVFSA